MNNRECSVSNDRHVTRTPKLRKAQCAEGRKKRLNGSPKRYTRKKICVIEQNKKMLDKAQKRKIMV